MKCWGVICEWLATNGDEADETDKHPAADWTAPAGPQSKSDCSFRMKRRPVNSYCVAKHVKQLSIRLDGFPR